MVCLATHRLSRMAMSVDPHSSSTTGHVQDLISAAMTIAAGLRL